MRTCGACGASVELEASSCPCCGCLTQQARTAFTPWWQRLLATLIDMAIVYAVVFVVGLLLAALGMSDDTETAIIGTAFVLGLFAYFALSEATKGTTLGKMVFRARVLRTDERAIGLGRALIRNAFKMVSLVTLGLASLLCILFSEKSQRVGDMVAGTVVIKRATGLDARVPPHTGAGAAPAAPELVRHQGQLNAAADPERARGEAGLNSVPWGAREAVLGFVVAQFPEIVPALLTLLAGITAASSMPTTARAVAAVVGTLVFDSWWVAWAWVFSLRKFRLGLSAWGFRRPGLSMLWLTPLAVFAGIVADLVYARFVTVPQSHLVSRFPHTTAGLVLLVIGACVLAPLFEETFFRGFLFQGLAAWRGAFWGAVISSALWSAVHMQPGVFVPLFVNGLLLCWVFRRGRSIWTNIAVHATINAIAVLAWVH
jgi:membrane protease YdiL (CAAX protease family)/uncharacterized RDD family membrane protein YckC